MAGVASTVQPTWKWEDAPSLVRGFPSKMKNILVVDDEPFIRDICIQFLSSAGYEVEARASGEEALEAVAHRSYDLLILDLRLKGIGGLTTLRCVRSIDPKARAIVVSGSVDRFASELENARNDGLQGVLEKPFALRDLSDLVESALLGQRKAA